VRRLKLSSYSLGRSAGGRGTIFCFEKDLFGELSGSQGARSHILRQSQPPLNPDRLMVRITKSHDEMG
jgi:hypothetical protein